jgi:hypothetical protein
MLPLTIYPELVIDDYIMRYNAIPICTIKAEPPCFADTRIEINNSMLQSYYNSNITWDSFAKLQEIIVYCVDPLSFPSMKEESDRILASSIQPQERKDPVADRFNYYRKLAETCIMGDSVNKWCYALATTEPTGEYFTTDWDTLMYAWDHKEIMHSTKELEEAYFGYKKFLMLDNFKLSGDWNFKSHEEKLEIAKGFSIGPHLKTLQPILASGVIADEVWEAWGLDPPEEESVSFGGFGSDDEMFW